MSNTLLCLTDASSFLNQERPKDFVYEPFLATSDKHTDHNLQDENDYVKNNGRTDHPFVKSNSHEDDPYIKNSELVTSVVPKQSVSRKREASNVLMECVKRRDSLRKAECASNVPCDSLELSSAESVTETSEFLHGDWGLRKEGFDEVENADLSDSSVGDSGIECSKGSSPVHSEETSSISGLDEDIGENLMEIDSMEQPTPKSCINDLAPQSVDTLAADDLNDLHLTDTTSGDEIEVVPKSPLIQSLFKHVPSMIYFSTKNEAVSNMPEHILATMKWKLSTITPAVVRQTVLKAGFSFVEADTTEDWLGTWGKHLKSSNFKKLKNFQKVNHYPGGFHLGRKDRLWQNYNKMVGRHGSEVYNFFPHTFILPADIKQLKEAWGDKSWIIKPCAAARGTGVKVVYKWCQVPKNKPNVVQHYISDPYLINGSKFDLRLYVLVSSFEPLRAYIFEDGLVRFASEKYSLANQSFSNRFIHLTNYSINRKSSSYASNDDENICQGHKWSLKSFWTYMANIGVDTEKIQATITDLIIKTVLSAEGPICRLAKNHSKTAYNCFELFGFDIMLDKDLHPWLLEVNISPSLHTKSKLDNNIKGSLVKDMFNIAGFEVAENMDASTDNCQSKMVGNRHKPLKNRRLSPEEKRKHALYTFRHSEIKSDILQQLTPDDLHCLAESEDEMQRRGSFTRIFPTETTGRYFPYFDHIRYYNVLLDAWEKTFHNRRQEGVKLLQDMCEKMLQPHCNTDKLSEMSAENGA